jgi:hypothetical protein
MDFGSGFWNTEDTDAGRAVAVILGLKPEAGTPDDHRENYKRLTMTKDQIMGGRWRKPEPIEES